MARTRKEPIWRPEPKQYWRVEFCFAGEWIFYSNCESWEEATQLAQSGTSHGYVTCPDGSGHYYHKYAAVR